MNRIFTLVILCLFALKTQSQVLTGTVADAENGQALPGTSVSIKGTSVGTATKSDGSFSLSTTAKPPFTGLGFAVGGLFAPSDLDVESVELIPSTARAVFSLFDV